MADQILSGISAFFHLTSLTMFSASIAASSYHYNVLKNVNWVRAMDQDFGTGGGTDVYIGFKAAAVHSGSSESVSHLNNCGDDALCYKCGGEGGKATLSFLAIALIFSFFSLAFTLGRFSNFGDKMMKFLQLVMNVICVGFGVAAFCNYADCKSQVVHELGKHNVHYGPGFGLCVCATFLVFLSFVFSSFVFGTSGPSQVPTKEPAQA